MLSTVSAPAAHATFPGENGRLAIATWIGADTSAEIYTVEPDGTGLTRLTDAPGDDIEPNWNADGSRIVFSTRRHDPAPSSACDATTLCERDLYVMNGDGTGQVRLTTTPGVEERDPAWSPDGQQIAYTTRTRLPSGNFREAVALINADGTNPHAVINDDLGQTNQASDPSWSRSGDRIAFSYGAGAGIAVANADGTGHRALDSGIDPNWSHYNGRILYRKGSISVWARHPDLGFSDKLSDIEGRDPVFSPDGRWIASHIARRLSDGGRWERPHAVPRCERADDRHRLAADPGGGARLSAYEGRDALAGSARARLPAVHDTGPHSRPAARIRIVQPP